MNTKKKIKIIVHECGAGLPDEICSICPACGGDISILKEDEVETSDLISIMKYTYAEAWGTKYDKFRSMLIADGVSPACEEAIQRAWALCREGRFKEAAETAHAEGWL